MLTRCYQEAARGLPRARVDRGRSLRARVLPGTILFMSLFVGVYPFAALLVCYCCCCCCVISVLLSCLCISLLVWLCLFMCLLNPPRRFLSRAHRQISDRCSCRCLLCTYMYICIYIGRERERETEKYR